MAFNLTLVRERIIRAFNIRGTEYILQTTAIPPGTDYTVAYGMIHDTMRGECYLQYRNCIANCINNNDNNVTILFFQICLQCC